MFMCLIGDFVLTDNEGLKLQATGCLLEKRLEKERALIIIIIKRIQCAAPEFIMFLYMNALKYVPLLFLLFYEKV